MKVDLPESQPLNPPHEALDWLGARVSSEVQPWFLREVRVAQELVGLEELMRDVETFARP